MSQEYEPISDGCYYNRSKKLGRGGYGFVFSGKYYGKDVAVKRVLLENSKPIEEALLAKLDHENVVKLIDVPVNKDFRFYVLELCAASLDEYCKGIYPDLIIPSEPEVLYQLTTGLEYIHSLRIIHRDIKPENILISKPDPIVKMKWADFGLSKAINENGSCSMSGNPGTQNWKAPEVLRLRVKPGGRGSKQNDIFSTGLVFFYFLTRVHPFGEDSEIESNIRNKKPVNLHELADDHFAKKIVIKMISHKVTDRMALKDIIQELEPHLPQNSSRNSDNQLLANRAVGVEAVGSSHKPMPSAAAKLPKKPTIKKEPKENIMSIRDVLSGARKKPRYVSNDAYYSFKT
ncbi:hypothetical protein OUZ56_006723 [Daphnia magna]|uniref:Protein kinase domain-containing protein n=1 Tax=Daphnia magna TaxID=35525 RepID=A0ABQ9YWI6_9CRUS|nr:hypothetical protein OUZ56_006723 [Daphnia magna]